MYAHRDEVAVSPHESPPEVNEESYSSHESLETPHATASLTHHNDNSENESDTRRESLITQEEKSSGEDTSFVEIMIPEDDDQVSHPVMSPLSPTEEKPVEEAVTGEREISDARGGQHGQEEEAVVEAMLEEGQMESPVSDQEMHQMSDMVNGIPRVTSADAMASVGEELDSKLMEIVENQLDPTKDVSVLNLPQKSDMVILPSKMRKLRALGMRRRKKIRIQWIEEMQEKRRKKKEQRRQERDAQGGIVTKHSLRSKTKKVYRWLRGEKSMGAKYTPYYELSEEDQSKAKALLVDLGYALGVYGLPAHRIEYHMTLVASYYGIDLYPHYGATALWLQFGNPADSRSVTSVVKINTSDWNLKKLCLVDDVADKISMGKISIKDARARITEIIAMRNLYAHWLITLFAFVSASASFAIYLNGTWLEIIASLIAGLIIGFSQILASRFAIISKVQEIGAALIAGMIGMLFRVVFSDMTGVRCQPFLVCIAGSFIYLPGMSITVSVAEISTRNLVAGTMRLVSSTWAILQLGFGVLFSAKLGDLLKVSIDDPDPHSNPDWAYAIATFCVIFPLIIFLRAPVYPLSILFINIACFAAFFISYYGSMYLDTAIGTFLGSFIVTILANIYARISRHPSIVVSACSIILLVPGSVGLRVFKGIIDRDTNASINYLILLLETCLALIFGIFAGEWIMPAPRRFSL